MSDVEIVNRRDERIRSVSDWEVLASPGEKRWRDGYSAKALAEAWIGGRGPAALTELLEQHGAEHFTDVRLQRAVAEEQTRFDPFGGPRNHDLLIEATDRRGTIVIGLEAKVNEPFGQTVGEYDAAAAAKREQHESTNAPERLAGLPLSALADADPARGLELGDLRYQLFSATAGTLAAAAESKRKADRAIFCVHDLITDEASEKARAVNAADLAEFVEVVFKLERPEGETWLSGPVRIPRPTKRLSGDIDLWIGHFVTAYGRA